MLRAPGNFLFCPSCGYSSFSTKLSYQRGERGGGGGLLCGKLFKESSLEEQSSLPAYQHPWNESCVASTAALPGTLEQYQECTETILRLCPHQRLKGHKRRWGGQAGAGTGRTQMPLLSQSDGERARVQRLVNSHPTCCAPGRISDRIWLAYYTSRIYIYICSIWHTPFFRVTCIHQYMHSDSAP